MHVYANLAILGVSGIVLLGFQSLKLFESPVAFALAAGCYLIFLAISFLNTRTWLEKEHDRKILRLRETYERKIRRLKNEYDTATLEKTIRDGTRTLIKNAVDYFKIENIKKEMKPSAAIQNLQLDKYGQIIELLADFSLILPDYDENRRIVQQEINHQIEIYRIDESLFAEFLRTIMGKYLMTVNKKIRERIALETPSLKLCPACSSRIPVKASVCRHCGHRLDDHANLVVRVDSAPGETETEAIRHGMERFREGELSEAVKHFTRAIELNPDSGDALFRRGVILEKMGDAIGSLRDLRGAAQLGHEKARRRLLAMRGDQTQEWAVD